MEQEVYFVEISSSTYSPEEMADQLRKIAAQIESGYTSGYYPTWSLIKENMTTEKE